MQSKNKDQFSCIVAKRVKQQCKGEHVNRASTTTVLTRPVSKLRLLQMY